MSFFLCSQSTKEPFNDVRTLYNFPLLFTNLVTLWLQSWDPACHCGHISVFFNHFSGLEKSLINIKPCQPCLQFEESHQQFYICLFCNDADICALLAATLYRHWLKKKKQHTVRHSEFAED